MPAKRLNAAITGLVQAGCITAGDGAWLVLFAAPFDLARLALTGSPVPVLEGVAATPFGLGTNAAGAAALGVSETGTLAYLPSSAAVVGAPIHWVDATGKATVLRATPANWSNPQFSPDGRRIAFQIDDNANNGVWVYDWARDSLSRLTVDPANSAKPVWTPDGRRIVFRSNRAAGRNSGVYNLYWQRADGSGEVQRLTDTSQSLIFASSWHPSGKYLAFYEANPGTSDDIMILPIEGNEDDGWKPGKPTIFLNTAANELDPMFSPDGRWIAYTSNESNRPQIYVRPFPGPGGPRQVSIDGGVTPTWSRTRHELFFAAPDNHLMVASYTIDGDAFDAEKPRLWSNQQFVTRLDQHSFDLHPDGTRFAMQPAAETRSEDKPDKLVFVFNFFDELPGLRSPDKG
jgi:serine/threonine-protein kinase